MLLIACIVIVLVSSWNNSLFLLSEVKTQVISFLITWSPSVCMSVSLKNIDDHQYSASSEQLGQFENIMAQILLWREEIQVRLQDDVIVQGWYIITIFNIHFYIFLKSEPCHLVSRCLRVSQYIESK